MADFFPPACTAPLAKFSYGFLLLTAYSLLGWCGEMVYCSIYQRKLCEKRGFLNGPLCPIYGHGAIIVLLCLHGGCKNPLLTFLLGAALTSMLEYVTSYAMEKLFHMRWWDYSHYKYHINGRVCLLNSTLFGLACVFLCHLANPPIANRLENVITSAAGIPLAMVLLLIYLADITLSVRSAIQISSRLVKLHAIHDELAKKLEELKLEHHQALDAERRRISQRKAEFIQAAHEKLEPLAEHGGEFTARLESAKAEARQKLHTLYSRPDFFERRMLHSFPTMRSTRHPEAMRKWREYLNDRRREKRAKKV